MGSASAKSRDLIFKHPGIFINLKSRDPRIPLRPDDNDNDDNECGYQATTKNNSQSPYHQKQSATKESFKLTTLVEHMGFHFRVTNVISNVL